MPLPTEEGAEAIEAVELTLDPEGPKGEPGGEDRSDGDSTRQGFKPCIRAIIPKVCVNPGVMVRMPATPVMTLHARPSLERPFDVDRELAARFSAQKRSESRHAWLPARRGVTKPTCPPRRGVTNTTFDGRVARHRANGPNGIRLSSRA